MSHAMKLLVFVGIILLPQSVYGSIPSVYTNENYQTSTHEQPVSFLSDGMGGFYGHTISGREFKQTRVINSADITLYKFSIDEAFFYISDKGQIWAGSDLEAISVYITS